MTTRHVYKTNSDLFPEWPDNTYFDIIVMNGSITDILVIADEWFKGKNIKDLMRVNQAIDIEKVIGIYQGVSRGK